MKYPLILSALQSRGALLSSPLLLLILSATFISLASSLAVDAFTIWYFFLYDFPRAKLSVHSKTSFFTLSPNSFSSSSGEVYVSSTVSWRIAAARI
jgi:hypothetical protein